MDNDFDNIKYENAPKKNKKSTLKNVVISFGSGILGASLVIGTCFGVPSIKENLIGTSPVNYTQTSISPSSPNLSAISLSEYSDTAIGVANKVLPSIVGIQIEYSINSVFNRTATVTASGSGIIINSDGYILTNNHVVSSSSSTSYYQMSQATSVKVKLYGQDTTYDAEIIGTDSETDLAVIKINAENLQPAELADSDTVQIGEFAMAIGNPLSLESSVTCGIISGINRKLQDSDGNTYNALQTDAAINAGNSGGALVNSEGKVIGINTLKLSGTGIEGIGFAIPINSTIDVYKQLIDHNKVIRPYLGIVGIDLNEANATKYNLVVGIYVQSVENFGSAQKAGIQAGDVITAIDGTAIKTMDELNEIKNKHNVGDEITLTINRNGTSTDVKVTLMEKND